MFTRWCARALAAVLLTGMLWLTGCDDRETLVIYSPHGKDLLEHYERAFEEAYPGVRVQWLDMGSQAAFDRVRTEAANPQASLWWGAPQTMFDAAAELDLLEPYRPTWADTVPEDARDPQDRWYGTFRTPEVILYNTRTVVPNEVPTTWDDLLHERFRGRVAVREPLHSGTMRTIFGALIMRAPTETDGFRWLARLDLNTRSYAADPTQLYLMLARGEADVTLWNLPDAYLQASRFGHPFGWVFPADGTPVLVDAIAIPRGAPNPERARQFYEFVTSREALIEQARLFHRIPVRTDIPAQELPDWMQQPVREMPMDWDRLRERESAWMRYWVENVKGRGTTYLASTPPPPEQATGDTIGLARGR
jgi:iron(III) transport system substrate-binding protein